MVVRPWIRKCLEDNSFSLEPRALSGNLDPSSSHPASSCPSIPLLEPDNTSSYTQAHSASIPSGSYTSGFKNIRGPDGAVNTWTFTGGGATGLFACPSGKDKQGYTAYKLYADVKGSKLSKKCLGMDALRDHYDGVAAWQYE